MCFCASAIVIKLCLLFQTYEQHLIRIWFPVIVSARPVPVSQGLLTPSVHWDEQSCLANHPTHCESNKKKACCGCVLPKIPAVVDNLRTHSTWSFFWKYSIIHKVYAILFWEKKVSVCFLIRNNGLHLLINKIWNKH